MRQRFVTCDVFTDTRFGGNPLAVMPDARGLTSRQMQQVAREFNYSESTFVLPPESGHDRRLRIFTPTREVPFAGHPTVGTAFVLAALGEVGDLEAHTTLTFEEGAGVVPVSIHPRGPGRFWCELRAPGALTLGPPLPVDRVAQAVSLAALDIRTSAHQPRVASVGLAFLVVELVDLEALRRARPDTAALERLAGAGRTTPDILVYVRTGAGESAAVDIRARMFAPSDGVVEDPATGSANCALAGLLASLEPAPDGAHRWRIAQGVEMGRPSLLEARVEKRAGEVRGVWIGGESVLVAEGVIEV